MAYQNQPNVLVIQNTDTDVNLSGWKKGQVNKSFSQPLKEFFENTKLTH